MEDETEVKTEKQQNERILALEGKKTNEEIDFTPPTS
jgi:hypothetical protein